MMDATKLLTLPNGPTPSARHRDGMRDGEDAKPEASQDPSYQAGYAYGARMRESGRARPSDLPAARSFYAA